MRKFLTVVVLAVFVIPAIAQPTKSIDIDDKILTAVPPKPFLLDIGDVRARTGRVPRGYGKLGLSKDQKERIYGVQAAYGERIKELEAEIDQLKDEQTVRIKAVLSDAQRLQVERNELAISKKSAEEE